MDRNRFLELQQTKLRSVKNEGYVATLIIENEDGEEKSIGFDVVEGISIDSNSNLTSHTMISGDVMSDHIYRQPDVVTISGSYGLFSSRNVYFEGENEKLANLEEYFENVKKKGLMITLITLNSSNSQQRFKSRKNLVLTSIKWNHYQTSISFSFTLTEQKTANILIGDVEASQLDENEPELTDGVTSSFTEEVLDWNKVYGIIAQLMYNDGLITDEFLNKLKSYESEMNTDLIIATSIAVVSSIAAFTTALAIYTGVLTSAGPVGWIALAITVAVGGAIYFVHKGIETENQKRKLEEAQKRWQCEQFKVYDDPVKQKAEIERFYKTVSNIGNYIKTLDDKISIFKVPVNKIQEMMIYIDDANYIFKFNKNTADSNWDLDIYKENELLRKETNIEESALNNLYNCNDQTLLTGSYTTNGYGIYLMVDDFDDKGNIDVSKRKDLRNYYILTSTINFVKFDSLLTDLIKNGGTIPEDRIEEYSL